MVSFEDFKKLDIRIGRIVAAEKIPETDKLLKLNVDLGGETRQIIAGIAALFPDPSVLVGREVPMVVNLELRKFKGHESQGMMLAADEGGVPILLHPAKEVPPGSVVR